MNSRILLASVLMPVCLLLSACAPAAPTPTAIPTAQEAPTSLPPTAAPPTAAPANGGEVDLNQVPDISSKLETVSVDFGNDRGPLHAFDSIWFLSDIHGKVTRWDPETRQVLATIQVGDPLRAPYGDPVAAAATDDAVWITSVATHEIVKIDPNTNEIVDRIALPKVDGDRELDAVAHMVLVGDTAWVHEYAKRIAQGVNLETGEAAGTFANVKGISSFGDSLWISRTDGVVAQIDAEANEVLKELPAGSPLPGLSAEGSLWGRMGSSIWRMDSETGEALAQIKLGVPVMDMKFANGSLWATVNPGPPAGCRGRCYLVQIDPKTNMVVGKIALLDAIDIFPYKDTVWVAYGDGSHLLLGQIRP